MTDKEKFEVLGIVEGIDFEIRELAGKYRLDLAKKVVYDVTFKKNAPKIVKGLYEHLLDGTWHKEFDLSFLPEAGKN